MDEIFNPPMKYLLKSQWGGYLALGVQPFEKHPIENVRFTDTMSENCNTLEECKAEMKRLQNLHMGQLGLRDLQCNFYVCGDGTVLEGRGWNAKSWKPKEYEDLKDSCIDIAYLTDLKEKKPSPEMKEASEKLIQWGKNMKFLKEDCNMIDKPE